MKCFPTIGHVLLGIFSIGIGLGGTQAAGDSKAMEDQKAALKILENGEIPTSDDGFFMKAKVDGKAWVAQTMMSTQATGRVLGLHGKESISLPFRKTAASGKKIKFGESEAVDLVDIAGVGLWSATKGEMVYTKVDATAVEGTFFFSAVAYDNSKKIEVTEGTFRVLLKKK